MHNVDFRIPDLFIPGSRIALVSPSFKVEKEIREEAFHSWQSAGFRPEFSEHSQKAFHNYSAKDEHRLSDLQTVLDDPEIKGIHCLRGGYGLTRYLDQLDFSRFLQSPKWVVGFSDITALLLAIENQGIACVHGPMASHFIHPEVGNALIDLLTKGILDIKWKDTAGLPDFAIHGTITGGNLTMLCHTIGTQYELQTAGKVLFIEEVGEHLYHTDRMMLQLRRAGKLKNVKAIVAGHFTDVKDTNTSFGKTVEEIIMDHAGGYGYPIAFGAPSGHHKMNLPIPIGVPVQIERLKGSCRISGSTGKKFA